jgi:hypothetical protein
MANDFCGPQVWPGTVQQLSGLSAYRKILKAFQHPHVRVQRAGRGLLYSARPEKEGSGDDSTSVFRVLTLSASSIT